MTHPRDSKTLESRSETPQFRSLLPVMQEPQHHMLLGSSAITTYAKLPTGSAVGTIHPMLPHHITEDQNPQGTG
jgi:hypothetical protein